MEQIRLLCDIARTYYMMWRQTGKESYKVLGDVAIMEAKSIHDKQNRGTELIDQDVFGCIILKAA